MYTGDRLLKDLLVAKKKIFIQGEPFWEMADMCTGFNNWCALHTYVCLLSLYA